MKHAAEHTDIVIHVCDEGRRIERDFLCDRRKLLHHMAYFSPYLTGPNAFQDIDISVHCDVYIFEWLVQYMNKEDGSSVKLETSSVVSILISSEFLQMSTLVTQCLQFIHDNMDAVISLPIDLACIGDSLIAPLSKIFSIEDIMHLSDPKDKMTTRLIMKHLEELLAQHEGGLSQCVYCHKVYPESVCDMHCVAAPIAIDHRGKITGHHARDTDWTTRRWLLKMRNKTKLSWKEIYWSVWGVTSTLYCTLCQATFVVCDYANCMYHPRAACFDVGANDGVYPCCDQRTLRFSLLPMTGGCASRNHEVPVNEKTEKIMRLISLAGNLLSSGEAPCVVPPSYGDHSTREDMTTSQRADIFKNITTAPTGKHNIRQLTRIGGDKHDGVCDKVPLLGDSMNDTNDGESSSDDDLPLKSPADTSFSRLKSRNNARDLSTVSRNGEKKTAKEESTRESDSVRMDALLLKMQAMRT